MAEAVFRYSPVGTLSPHLWLYGAVRRRPFCQWLPCVILAVTLVVLIPTVYESSLGSRELRGTGGLSGRKGMAGDALNDMQQATVLADGDGLVALVDAAPLPVPLAPRNVSTDESGRPCLTAPFGTRCYSRVMWVMREGIVDHPDWYKGLDIFSSFEEIQGLLHARNEENCGRPCPTAMDPSTAVSSLPILAGTAGLGLPKNLDNESSRAELGKIRGKLAIVEQMAENAVDPVVCNSAMEMAGAVMEAASEVMWPESSDSLRWQLNASEREACFELLLEKKVVKPEDRSLERNWCWVGLKEVGCHWHQYDHLPWNAMQDRAIFENGTISVPYAPLAHPEICDKSILGGPREWTELDWNFASRWFKRTVSVYVLSLPESLERRTISKRRLNHLQIPFEFVDGVDMRQDGALDSAMREGIVPEDFNMSRAQEEAYRHRENMGVSGSIVGTLGCASGHFRAQSHALNQTNPKELIVILEDDVSPADDFVAKLWRLVTQELPCDWQAVSLNSRCPFGRCVSPHLTRVHPDINEPAWRCHHGVNYGFQGVLYRTDEIENLQKKWKPVAFDEARPHCLDVDVALASISDEVRFYAVPASQNPGLLNELPEGSSRVDINFEEMDATTTTTAAESSTTTTITLSMETPATTTTSSLAEANTSVSQSSLSSAATAEITAQTTTPTENQTSSLANTTEEVEPTTSSVSPNSTSGDGHCLTALNGSECHDRILWVQNTGVPQHPTWYPGLSKTSNYEEVQAWLHRKGEKSCRMPCQHFCGAWQDGQPCGKDLTGNGWCSAREEHCTKSCKGTWCERGAFAIGKLQPAGADEEHSVQASILQQNTAEGPRLYRRPPKAPASPALIGDRNTMGR